MLPPPLRPCPNEVSVLPVRLPVVIAALLFALAPAAATAEDPPRDDLETRTLETVVVSGVQPGPGLWRVVAPNGNTMWVLGRLLPLPKRMEWTATEVEEKVIASERVLLPPTVDFDVKAGFFAKLGLLPAALRARNNPGKQPLVEVVPPELYARWSVLKKQYMGRDRGVEKRRPIVAAQELLEEALDDHDLSWKNIAAEKVRKTARKHDVELHTPSVAVTIEDPKALLRELNESSLSDLDCFEKTLLQLETDIEPMKLRANAWALGEIGYLRSVDMTRSSYRACSDAVLETQIAKKHGFADLEQRLREAWLADAEDTLGKHARSFAVLPMSLVLADSGYLAELGRRGYRIEAPDAEATAEPAAGATADAAVDAGGAAETSGVTAAAVEREDK
jgi:hypothetical protein